MISNLDVFKIYSAMARHAAESQRVAATNISRADEPGYKASQIETFQDFLARTALDESAASGTEGFKTEQVRTGAKPNGNTVKIEQEAFRAADAVSQHEMALSVYTKSLDLLRSAIGKKM